MDEFGNRFATSDLAAPVPQTQFESDPAFNGNQLCLTVRDELEKTHRQLTDPTKRAAFDRKWSNVCQSDPRIGTESGTDQVVQEMISSMGERFDHYFDRQGYIALHNAQSGTDIGLGVETEIDGAGQFRAPQPYEAQISQNHPLVIRSVTPESPAAEAGLLVGDQILAINGQPTGGLKRREALAKIEGVRDANVHLQISRPLPDGTFEPHEIDASETLVKDPTASYKSIGDGVGYIKLRNFMADEAAPEMFAALGQTVNDKAIVLDLRNNNGGRVGTMEEIAELMLTEGQLVREETRSGDGLKIETTSVDRKGMVHTDTQGVGADSLTYPRRADAIIPETKPIVVLVDEYSASAAEMLAGALRVNERAIIVGVPTTGKSEGQQLIDLPYARGAALTSFEFFPGGRPVPHTGLEPDIIVKRGNDDTFDNQLATAKRAALALAMGIK